MTTFLNPKEKLMEVLSYSIDLIGVAATIDLLIEVLEKMAVEYKSQDENLKASSIKSFAEKLKALKVF